MDVSNKLRMRHFIFGVDVSPWWFLQKVESKDVDYVTHSGKVSYCRFYDIKGNERNISIGQMITVDMLYKEEPEKRQMPITTYRHYSMKGGKDNE